MQQKVYTYKIMSMSENEIEKRTKEVLGSSKSSVAKAMVLMSISMDNMTAAITENQKKVDERILQLEAKTDKRFEKLKFWAFLSDYGWIGGLITAAVIILIIWAVQNNDPTAIINTIK